MRRAIGVVLLMVTAPAGAEVGGAGLRPGETALHIVAHGETSSRADRVALPVTVSGRGATVAAAREAAEAGAAQLVQALIAAGIDRTAITRAPATLRVTAMPPVVIAPLAPAGMPGVPRTPSVTQTALVRLALSDPAMLERARQVIAGQEQAQAGTPVLSLADDAPARRTAIGDALAHARRDADDYAAALGLRVVRVVAVANAGSLGDGLESVVEQFSEMSRKKDDGALVVTRATAVIDYALGPRG